MAISNDRLLSVDDGQVRFRWTDYAHGHRVKTMTLAAAEFLRRFLLHVLPGGFVRIRHFGFLANRGRTAKLARCRALLAVPPPPPPASPEPVAALVHRRTGVDLTACPVCRAGRLRIVAVFRPGARPGPGRGYLMSPPAAAAPCAPTPRPPRRVGRVWPPPVIRRPSRGVGVPPPTRGPSAVPAGRPGVPG